MLTWISRRRSGWMLALLAACTTSSKAPPAPKLTKDQVLEASKPEDWRTPDPENMLYMELPGGQVVFELAPQFAPRHVANIRTLVREKFFDGLPIVRVQDNYVVQWGDSEGKKPIGTAQRALPPEFTRALEGLSFHALPDRDTYAPETGFADGFPAARDSANGKAWAVHCYGMLGVGRDNAADSGGGTELYVVNGHAPRHLDRNVTLVGRVLRGIDLLSALPRGHDAMGFYEASVEKPIIARVRVGTDVPAQERHKIQLLRTDTPTFDALVESRRNRSEEWFKQPAGHIEVCNVPLPARVLMGSLSGISTMGQ